MSPRNAALIVAAVLLAAGLATGLLVSKPWSHATACVKTPAPLTQAQAVAYEHDPEAPPRPMMCAGSATG
jgi:hypothetical protein